MSDTVRMALELGYLTAPEGVLARFDELRGLSHNRIVFITTPDLDTAESIANALLDKRLAACVNIFQGLRSMYHWEGKIEDDQEILLMIKTRAELLEKQLIPLVQKLHPYQVPEIIALPIVGGGQSYLDWILSETGGIESHNLES